MSFSIKHFLIITNHVIGEFKRKMLLGSLGSLYLAEESNAIAGWFIAQMP
jgi:hypothetical protein